MENQISSPMEFKNFKKLFTKLVSCGIINVYVVNTGFGYAVASGGNSPADLCVNDKFYF